MFRNRHSSPESFLLSNTYSFVLVKMEISTREKKKERMKGWGLCARSSFTGKKKQKEIIVAAGVYPCPYPSPYLQRRFHRRFRNSATTCQTSPRRRVIPQFAPWDRRHAEAKVDRAHQTVQATRPLSLTRLEKQIGPGHRRMNHGDGDDDDRKSEVHFCEKRCRPRYHSRRAESA